MWSCPILISVFSNFKFYFLLIHNLSTVHPVSSANEQRFLFLPIDLKLKNSVCQSGKFSIYIHFQLERKKLCTHCCLWDCKQKLRQPKIRFQFPDDQKRLETISTRTPIHLWNERNRKENRQTTREREWESEW
jgi:hypothetical protein